MATPRTTAERQATDAPLDRTDELELGGSEASGQVSCRSLWPMCRNITMLRGLEPPATAEEIEAAARQYVRKVGGLQAPSERTSAAMEKAVAAVATATAQLLGDLPERRQPPPTLPPLRRRAALG
jgi:hypothetical protein